MKYEKMTNTELVREIKVLKSTLEETARKRSEERITSIAHIVEESLNEIYIFDVKTLQFIQANKGARLNLGYSMDELYNLTPLDLKPEFTPGSFERLIGPLRTGKKEKIRFETVHQRKDGSLYDIEVHLQYSTFQSNPVFVAIILDISERKQAEKSLFDYKQQMYAFSLATTNMLWNWDLINGTIVRNIGFEKAFGYTKEEIVPDIEWWIDRLHPDDCDRIFSIYENAVKKGEPTCSYEYRFRHNNGNYSYISDNVYIIRGENGKAIRALGAMTDITKRKEAEEMQQKHNKVLEQKNMALSEVLGQLEIEKKQIKDNITANAENLILPIIQKLKLAGVSHKYINDPSSRKAPSTVVPPYGAGAEIAKRTKVKNFKSPLNQYHCLPPRQCHWIKM